MASIRKRTTRRGGARYDVRYRNLEGEQREETFRTRREADQRVHAIEADKLRGGWLDPRRASRPFGEVAEEWFTANPAKRSGTRARDRSILDRHVLPTLRRSPVGSVAPRSVQVLVSEWCKRMRPGSVCRCFDVLRAIFNYAVESDIIARSPCRGVKLPPVESKARHVVSADELAGLADGLGVEYAPMAYLGALLGLRWGEVAGLRVRHVDFFAGTVAVAEQLTRGERGCSVLSAPKSAAGRRVLSAPKMLLDMLAAHLARRGLTGADVDAFVFTSPRGEPLDYSHWRRRFWLPACSRAGLEGLVFHDLRRAAATALVLERVDMKTAQTRLGHSDPRLTLGLYAQASSEADRDAADRVGARYLGGGRDGRGMEAGDVAGH
jgi:integrase